jgi:hypothetical protein
MLTTNVRARLALPIALVLGLAGCVINLNFDIPRSFQIDVPVANGTFSQTFPVDFSQQAEIQQHKGSIDSLSFESLDLTVTQVNTSLGTNTLTALSGTVSLRPDGATDASMDVLVGTLTNFPITLNSTVNLKGSPALDAFLLQAVKGTGKFSIIVTGTPASGNQAHFVLLSTLHAGLGYNTGIF